MEGLSQKNQLRPSFSEKLLSCIESKQNCHEEFRMLHEFSPISFPEQGGRLTLNPSSRR